MKVKHESLEALFHEPSRIAIMSELCSAEAGLSFGELKERCELTDGNLSRHLQTLEKHQAIEIEKAFVNLKPRTTAKVTSHGREQFLEYLSALEEVLRTAAMKVEQITSKEAHTKEQTFSLTLGAPKKA